MGKKVYISGAIGEQVISEGTRRKFALAEEMLKKKGYDVFNPTNVEWEEHLKKRYVFERDVQPDGEKVSFYAYALLRDQMALATKDAIYLLDDWRLSPGATAEHYFSRATGKQMLFQNRWDAEEYLWGELLEKVRKGNPPGCWLEYDDTTTIRGLYVRDNINRVWMPVEELNKPAMRRLKVKKWIVKDEK